MRNVSVIRYHSNRSLVNKNIEYQALKTHFWGTVVLQNCAKELMLCSVLFFLLIYMWSWSMVVLN